MRDYRCFECDYVTIYPERICLMGDGWTELCPKHCGCTDHGN